MEKKPFLLIFLGPPGCGKGTQASLIHSKLNLAHISTGDLFRSHIRTGSKLGLQFKEMIDRGMLIEDSLVCKMVFERLSEEDAQNGAILDGFPRTVLQAKILEEALSSQYQIQVFQFKVDPKLLIERITGRLSCKTCGSPYHKFYSPPKIKNLCDSCEGPLYQRADDTEKVLEIRLSVYSEETFPLIEFYEGRDVPFITLDASLSKEAITNLILLELEKTLIHL